jgi:hypothetical protein
MSTASQKKNKKRFIPVSMLSDVPENAYSCIDSDCIPYGMIFDVWENNTIEYLWKKIEERKSVINIGFVYLPADRRRLDLVSAAEFGSLVRHAEVYFGEHVCRMSTSKSLHLFESPSMEHKNWEMVSLPFNNTRRAFEIGMDIIKQGYTAEKKTIVKFSFHFLESVEHFLSRLLSFNHHGENDFYVNGDYDPKNSGEWKHGIHCSQLVLLFLKRCVIENVIDIPSEHRDRFLNLYSFTCLPSGLRLILNEVWPCAGSEFIDYSICAINWETEQ